MLSRSPAAFRPETFSTPSVFSHLKSLKRSASACVRSTLVILNLMPKKIETEAALRLISKKVRYGVEIDFMKTSTHEGTHVSADHLVKF